MPKDRKETYSDRQSQASRAKKQAKNASIPAHVRAKKQIIKHEDFSQAAVRIVEEATKDAT